MATLVPAMRPIPEDPPCTAPALPRNYEYHAHVSYCSQDRELARHLLVELNSKGFKCFEKMPGASHWNSQCDKCWKIIIVVSKEYLLSNKKTLEAANHLEKSAEDRKRLVIPVLHRVTPTEVPSYLREVNYILTTDPGFWGKLLDALREDVILSATIPTEDIAEGLAWHYYLGYLALVLPGIQERAQDSNYPNIFNKFIVLMPSSGYCARPVKEMDSNIKAADPPTMKFLVTRSANVQRDYNSSVLQLEDPDTGKKYHVIMEFATPIWTMYEMELGRIAGLSQEAKLNEIQDFQRILGKILKHSEHCRDKYILLPFDDRADRFESDPHALSRMVVTRIKQEQLQEGISLLNLSD